MEAESIETYSFFVLHGSLFLLLLQVFAEGLPQLLRCVIVVSGVLLAPHWGLTIFSTAQVSKVVHHSSLPPTKQYLFWFLSASCC